MGSYPPCAECGKAVQWCTCTEDYVTCSKCHSAPCRCWSKSTMVMYRSKVGDRIIYGKDESP